MCGSCKERKINVKPVKVQTKADQNKLARAIRAKSDAFSKKVLGK